MLSRQLPRPLHEAAKRHRQNQSQDRTDLAELGVAEVLLSVNHLNHGGLH
jgi:hypothetical protein